MKKESFELGFEAREEGKIPQDGRQRIPDSWSNETERTVANRVETAFRDSQKFLARGSEGVWKSDMCREKPKSKREVYRQNDGRQELRHCFRSGISQAANGVHSAVE